MTNRAHPARALRGISLIEAVIYIGLSTFLIGSVLAASYPLFTSTERQSARTVRDTETAVVSVKIIQILNAASSITAPAVGSTGSTLIAVTAQGTVTVSLSGNAVAIDRGAGVVPITTSRVSISNLSFSRIVGSAGTPDAIKFSFSANGTPVPEVIRYVKN